MRIQREGTIQSHPAAIGDPGAGAVTMEGLIIGQWSLVRPAHKMLTSVGWRNVSWVATLLARNQRPNKISNGVLECRAAVWPGPGLTFVALKVIILSLVFRRSFTTLGS